MGHLVIFPGRDSVTDHAVAGAILYVSANLIDVMPGLLVACSPSPCQRWYRVCTGSHHRLIAWWYSGGACIGVQHDKFSGRVQIPAYSQYVTLAAIPGCGGAFNPDESLRFFSPYVIAEDDIPS
ncbi:hypothetical protein XSR1_20270 [Xenorhabdus szentirmaii DSM 16338]|uniref:Uncharacterized protein n=1 Tax=Xenorhabdus szentirmaii DSM 16338 TaxID=1427518 RepID=W1IZ39_9GAMM|nr:hypothetical protein XSR1_20270 [Xenorhabdus szentirmaii DSM 16338]